MKRRIALATAAVLMVASLTLAFASALEYSGTHVFRNVLNTSGVNLQLEQFRMTDRGMVPAEKGMPVVPGERLSYIPRVTNLETDSYIRVRFEVSASSTGVAITPESFYGTGSGWIRKGNFFYCRNVFGQGDSSEVIQGLVVPQDIADRSGEIRIKVTADAIQARNFTPDFDAYNPWGTVEIQTLDIRRGTGNHVCRNVVKTQSMDFSFAREGTFECSTEDLFSEFDSFQPGDTCREKLDMKNNSGKKLNVYFRTDNVKTELLEEMKLSISCCGSKVYSGPLTSEALSSFIKIGTIEKGRAGKLEFEISLPENADNRFSMLDDQVTWIIAVKDAENDGTEKKGRSPATGELWIPLAIATLGICGATLAAVIALTSGRRKDRKDD